MGGLLRGRRHNTISRTDKDMPFWVTTTWWQPRHYGCDSPDVEHGLGWWSNRPRRRCDLPAEPTLKSADGGTRTYWRLEHRCRWVPAWDRRHQWSNGPDREFVHVIWHGPERRSVRDDCLRAIAEYRADGTVDVQPSTRQARGSGHWLW